MRTISLVKRLKWNFSGNMNPHALVIGDVDNDNENEFVIGNLNGDLAIFKGECIDGFPSFVCRGLGTITCIAIGDVRNHGKNSVVIINAEGHAHIFDIPPKSKTDQQHHQNISVDDYLKGGRRSSDTASIQAFRRMMSVNGSAMPPPPLNEGQEFRYNANSSSAPKSSLPYIHDLGKPNLTLKVPVNVNKILIADIDHDDLNELILARTDRILHAFQLVPSDFSNTPFDHMYKGVQTPSIASLSPSASTTSLNGLSPQPPSQQKRPSVATTSVSTGGIPITKDDVSTRKINLLDKNMWVFDGQISSLCTTTHPDRPNEPLLLVAQPGNTFTIIDQDGKRYNKDFTPQQTTTTTSTTETKRSSPPPISNINVSEDENRIKSLLLNKGTEEESVNIEIFKDESTKSNESDVNFKRSNYVVKNWPVMDTGGGNNNDDVIDDEIESGAVATEIVIGKRHLLGDSFSSSEVGMLSMDGKFSIYDLLTNTTSQRDLFVTHKLFSLATLDVSSPSTAAAVSADVEKSGLGNARARYGTGGTQTPMSGTSNLRYEATPRLDTPPLLNEGSRNSSKISLNALVNSYGPKDSQNNSDNEDDVINKRTTASTESDTYSDGNGGEDGEDESDYESVPWSEGSESENEPGCDLFVACAWNGVTYLIDWSKRIGDDEDDDQWATDSDTSDTEKPAHDDTSKIKYQLVKFAFEGRVCAFTAGLYAVENQMNVPCLFYVDFEDQIYVYYDVRISPGPVTGFIDRIDDDVEEALDRIIGIESGIEALIESNHGNRTNNLEDQDEDTGAIDLGDGWQGIADDEDEDDEDDIAHVPLSIDQQQQQDKLQDSGPINLADFIHECLYGFEDMKDRMETEMLAFEQSRLSNRLPAGGDTRRLSDLNITIEPPSIDNDLTSDSGSLRPATVTIGDDEDEIIDGLYPINSHTSAESSESYDNNTHIASWIEGSLIGSSIFNKEDDDDDDDDDDDEDDCSEDS
ncbi:hypothetical protein EDC94DRAFT_690370 [Helicostylum pulchrum]|nr:hypothetical protein EDC94DRAFT_690370 [Helicostylum pulchrum]